MTSFPIHYLIYGYMYVSAALLLFNALFMKWADFQDWLHAYRTKRWMAHLIAFRAKRKKKILYKLPVKRIRRQLSSIEKLMTFADAAETMDGRDPKLMRCYWRALGDETIRFLTVHYSRRNSMERAYFAWFLGRFQLVRREQQELITILMGYMENSTVYCRENVLQAVYRIGSPNVVVTALGYISRHHYYHDVKLLSDGLQTFTGNKEDLARLLWQHNQDWDELLLCAVVQFVTRMKGAEAFAEPFLEALRRESTHREVRIALLRYFTRVRYEAVRPLLLDFLKEKDQAEFAIVSASALRSYPGDDTIAALKKAISSRNWHVRSNAAASLIALAKDPDGLDDILNGPDRFAREMLSYQLRKQNRRT